MNWVRCPKCRTIGDADRSSRCFGCGLEMRPLAPPAARPAPRLSMPPVQRQAQGDTSATNIVLLVLGLIGAMGVLLMAPGFFRVLPGLAMLVVFATIVGAIVAVLHVTRPKNPTFDVLGKVVLRVFAAIGILLAVLMATGVGFIILLFVMCATSARGGRLFG